MKVNNIVFSGFMAAILVGTCGAANAATATLATKGYVDGAIEDVRTNDHPKFVTKDELKGMGLVSGTELEASIANKQDKLEFDNAPTAGSENPVTSGGVYTALAGKANVGDIPSIEGLVDEATLAQVQTALQEAIDGKQASGDYATADALAELAEQVAALTGSSASNEVIEALNTKVNEIYGNYATDTEVTDAIAEVRSLIPSLDGYAKTADLAAVATSGSYNDLSDKPTIPSIEGLATSEALTNLQTTLEAAIENAEYDDSELVADMTAAQAAIATLQSGKADAGAITALQTAINNLGSTYATTEAMNAADKALQDAISAINLDDYVKSTDLADYATQDYVQGQITTATSKLATKSELQDYAKTTALNSYALKTDLDAYETKGAADAALVTAKAYTDEKVADIKAYDDTAVRALITTNAGEIAKNAAAIENIKVPTKTSELINDSEYVTSSALNGFETVENAAATYQLKGDYLTANSELSGAKIAAGTVAESALDSNVQASLSNAANALQKTQITTGTTNGTIAVAGTDVPVAGLGGVAYLNPELPTYDGSFMLMVDRAGDGYTYSWVDIEDYVPSEDYGDIEDW